MSDNIIAKFEAKLMELDKLSDEFQIHVQPSETINNGTILLMHIPSVVHNDDIEELAQGLYQPFGNVIKVVIQKNQFFDEDTPKQAYVLIDLKSSMVPPKKQDTSYRNIPIKITTQVNSKLLYCAYCRIKGHHITQCPLRKNCPACSHDHKLFECQNTDEHRIRKGMALIPQAYVDNIIASTPPENIPPRWILSYEYLLPERSKNYTDLIKDRYMERLPARAGPQPEHLPDNSTFPHLDEDMIHTPSTSMTDPSTIDNSNVTEGFQYPRNTGPSTINQSTSIHPPQDNPYSPLDAHPRDDPDGYQPPGLSFREDEMDIEE